MKMQRYFGLVVLGLVADMAFVACKTKMTCDDYAMEPGCDSAAGSSATGGTGNGGNGGLSKGGAAGGSSSPCNGACSGTTPVCNTGTNNCVECVTSSDCKDSTKAVCDIGTNNCVSCLSSADCKDATKPQCNTATKSCVACLSNADCTTATASLCNATTNTCGPCSADADCGQISGKNACSAGTCVQCTAANETACGTNSCNPKTNTCSSTVKGSRKTCQSCVADSECGTNAGVVDPNSRCVPMTFNGAAHGPGGYCLQKVSTGCSSPYAVSFTAISLSGATSDAYCGINQTATTCEAVLDLASAKICSVDGDCGGGQGGLCKAISVVAPADRCTIPCGSPSNCLSSAPGDTCSGSTNGWCQ